MSRFERLAAGFALAAGLAVPAQAAVVPVGDDGQWHPFDVDRLIALSGELEWIDLGGEPLVFQVNLTAPTLLRVVDGGFGGDRFAVTVDGRPAGQTSPAIDTFPVGVGIDFDAAFADGRWSRGLFPLTAGLHTVAGVLSASTRDGVGIPLDATVGAVSLAPAAVSSPAPWALLVAGIGGLRIVRRPTLS